MSSGPQIAALDQSQRVEQLGAEPVGAPAVVSQRSERAERFLLAHIGAEIAFQRPERDDDRRRHAVLLVDPRKYLRVGLDLRRPGLNAIGSGHAIGEFQKRLREHPLAAVDVDDALVVGEVGRDLGDRALRHAVRDRLALERGEPSLVRPAGAARRGGARRATCQRGREQQR